MIPARFPKVPAAGTASPSKCAGTRRPPDTSTWPSPVPTRATSPQIHLRPGEAPFLIRRRYLLRFHARDPSARGEAIPCWQALRMLPHQVTQPADVAWIQAGSFRFDDFGQPLGEVLRCECRDLHAGFGQLLRHVMVVDRTGGLIERSQANQFHSTFAKTATRAQHHTGRSAFAKITH